MSKAESQTLRIVEFNSMLLGGGTDDRGVRTAHQIAQLGHRVVLAGPEGREYSKVARELGLTLHALPARGALRLPMIREVARLLRRERPHIFQARHGRDYWPAIMAAGLSGVRPRVVLCRHLAKSPSSWLSRRFMLSRCDALVAVSEFVAKVLREGVYEPGSPEPERRCRPPMRGDLAKIRVVRSGFDMDLFRPMKVSPLRQEWGLGPEHFVFAVVGGYPRPRGKGQREFLQAAARLRDATPQARFLIVGRGDLKADLEADIERLGLRGRAWLTPYCNDMPMAMNAIDCLVHPQMGTEALPGVVIEAHACGKPVIATAVDGNPEAFNVTGCGQLIRPESVDELAAAMQGWAGKPPLSMTDRQRMHEQVGGSFSLERAAGDFVSLYRELLNTEH